MCLTPSTHACINLFQCCTLLSAEIEDKTIKNEVVCVKNLIRRLYSVKDTVIIIK